MENAQITLTTGLLGLESYTKFKFQPFEEGTPFYTLQSLESSDLSLIVMDPALLVEAFAFDLGDDDVKELGITDPDDVMVMVVLTVPENPQDMTANLLGPLVINRTTNKGKQIVLHGSDWPVRYRVFAAAQKAEAAAKGGK
ncbi:MAG: flagellar assembly protein FliW [Candidatus Sericytochromatia bacterium]|nr:flagellar assembly protein FliW [Candidatus Sericytochromatia bacterium]